MRGGAARCMGVYYKSIDAKYYPYTVARLLLRDTMSAMVNYPVLYHQGN